MPKITQLIPNKNFEVIRDMIGAILTDELDGQYQMSYEEVLDVNGVWIERNVPFGVEELPAVNVSLGSGQFGNRDIRKADGTYQYAIDCYVKAPSTTDYDGDSEATLRLHRLMGVIYAILSNSRYKHLNFENPASPIASRYIEQLIIDVPQKDGKDDMFSTINGRLIFNVVAAESFEDVSGVVLAVSSTVVKLVNTDKGYKFEYQTP